MNGKPPKIILAYVAVIGALPMIGGRMPLNKPQKPSPLTVAFSISLIPVYSNCIHI